MIDNRFDQKRKGVWTRSTLQPRYFGLVNDNRSVIGGFADVQPLTGCPKARQPAGGIDGRAIAADFHIELGRRPVLIAHAANRLAR